MMDRQLQALGQAALALERAGRHEEAEDAYRRLLVLYPDLPDTWFNLALLQRRAGRFEAALDSYQQALDRGITQPEEVHLNRGVIYADCLRRDEAAAAELRTALQLNPRYVPALLNLANLQEDLGQRDEALRTYERLLAVDPRCHVALARYANLRTATGPETPDVVERLRQSLALPGLAPGEAAMLGFALGTALDKAGAYDDAFAAFEAANRQSRLSAGPGGARYDREQHERFIDDLIAAFPPASASAVTGRGPVAADTHSPGPPSGTQPIFVCGMFRSGSTLVEQILSSHAGVASGGELDVLPGLVRSELTPFPASVSTLSPARSRALATRYLDRLALLHPGARFVIDKRPDNFLYIGLIKTLLPDARIVHTVRNAWDNCLSVFFLHLDTSMSYALDLADIGHYYRQYQRLMAHWRSLYGDDIHDVSYDDLVHEPRPSIERLLQGCGLDWDEDCLRFHDRAHAVKTASVWQVRQPLYTHASGRARNYAGHLGALAQYIGEFLPR